MFILSLLLGLAAAKVPAAQSDQAGNRLEALLPMKKVKDGEKQPMLCTADRHWCVLVSSGEGSSVSAFDIFENLPPNATAKPSATHILESNTDYALFTAWSHIVRLRGNKDEILIGVQRQNFNGYSGGGGSATVLTLYRLSREGKGRPVFTDVLTTTVSAGIMIRACFNERDRRDRLGACHDEYGYSTKLRLDPVPRNGMPRFDIQTEASTYPADVSRNGDSLARGKLRKQDLVHKRHERCSYRRILTFDPKMRYYAPDAPEPDCSEFTVP